MRERLNVNTPGRKWWFHTATVFILLCFQSCYSHLPQDVQLARKKLSSPVDFNFDVKPILSEYCFPCHGPDEKVREAGFRLDQQDEALSFSSEAFGSAIQPGNPGGSSIIKRVMASSESLIMPPPEAKMHLSAAAKATLYHWIEEGAEWKPHWAYLSPQKSPLPLISDSTWAINEIDYFIRAKMKEHQLQPTPEAPREALIRRLSLDLTGLPPRLEEIDVFLADTTGIAYEKVVDKYLASPHFGERWTWDWLDAARYADTNGFQGDPERKMWPWRDWVIQALNENMPYDQFTVEQLAGDLIPEATHDQILATAFNRNHMYNGEGGRIPEETRVENVFDRTETVGTIWMGMTLNCCRCHDHKFDPIAQREYYQMYDYFNQTSEEGIGYSGMIRPVIDLSPEVDKEKVREIQKFVEEAADQVFSYEEEIFPRDSSLPASESTFAADLNGDNLYALSYHPLERNPYYLGLLSDAFKEKDPGYYSVLKSLRETIRKKDRLSAQNLQVMVMDQLTNARTTYILDRGIYNKRGDTVTASIPSVLSTPKTHNPSDRLELARWLVGEDHPLTARVTVNRFWQSFFGKGIVATPGDFGVQGEKPTHPKLLDWLARDFIENGWNLKRLMKQIVMSATYRQGSQVDSLLLQKDPENKWLARAPRYRIPSWMMRDQVLSFSDLLSDSIGGPPVKPYQPNGVWEEATFGFKSYTQDTGQDLYRRSIYIFWRRIVGPTMFFDNSSRQVCEVKPTRTNTPLHALVSLNDIAYMEAARVMAEHLLRKYQRDEERIDAAFRTATARHPSEEEQKILLDRLKKLKASYLHDPDEARKLTEIGEYDVPQDLNKTEHAAYTGICSLIINLDETITRQ